MLFSPECLFDGENEKGQASTRLPLSNGYLQQRIFSFSLCSHNSLKIYSLQIREKLIITCTR